MNFSGIRNDSPLGKALRLPLRFIPEGWRLRVWQGPARGYRWISGSSTHGCWIGSYEADKVNLFAHHIDGGETVYDIGAHVGYYTLVAARLVGPRGHVVAFEPLPANLSILKEHLHLNRISNVTIVGAAVGRTTGRATFAEHLHSTQGHLSNVGNVDVPVWSLDDYLRDSILEGPSVMKIDVEGAELEVLKGATHLLARCRPVIFLATHSPSLDQACRALLGEIGYRLDDLLDRQGRPVAGEIVARPVTSGQ
jgi:FkbM family methyltransferase